MVTIKQIAELCGVSRGTVDRVLNGRGKVKPEKERLVLEMAAKLNYHPNPAGKALAARKKHPIVGVLLLSEGVHFFDDVLHSMHRLADKYDSYGLKVIWRSMRGFDIDKQCAMIDELREQGINALIMTRSTIRASSRRSTSAWMPIFSSSRSTTTSRRPSATATSDQTTPTAAGRPQPCCA